MNFNHSVVVFCLILMVMDFFVPNDVPTFLAYILLSFLVFYNIDVDLLYRLLFAIVAFFILLAFHFTIWTKIVQKFINKFISPTKHQDGPQGLIGLVGKTTFIEGEWYVRIDGDIWRCQKIESIADGVSVEVIDYSDGMLEIKNI